jgi:hypothetical protein
MIENGAMVRSQLALQILIIPQVRDVLKKNPAKNSEIIFNAAILSGHIS